MYGVHLLFVIYIYSVLGVSLEKPSELPCILDDKKCLKDMVQWLYNNVITGDPKLGLEKLDPLYQELIDANLAYVKFFLKKTTAEDFKSCKVTETSIDSHLTELRVTFWCPRFHLDGEYEIDGKVLSFPVRGNGGYYIDTTNYKISYITDIRLYRKGINNNIHAKIGRIAIQAELLGGLDFELRNLFDGNKKLSYEIHNFGKQNPKLFASVLQGPILENYSKKVKNNLNKLFEKIPVKDLVQADENFLTIENIQNLQF